MMGKRGKKEKEILGIDEGFLATVSVFLSKNDLQGIKLAIARYEAHKQEARDEMKGNEVIQTLEQQLKDMKGPFQDTIKACRNRQRHLINILKEKGEFAPVPAAVEAESK
jgi:hypothetical protein